MFRRHASWLVPVLIALSSLVVSGWVGYGSNDKDMSNRVTAVEVQQENDGKHLEHIEQRFDKQDEKLDRLNDNVLQILRELR